MKFLVSMLSLLMLSPLGLALYGGEPLERVHFQPWARDIIYSELTNINTMNYMNVSEVYTRVIESNQLVAALRNAMGKRLNISVPPPHRHCFISERDLQHLPVINQANSTQGLRCDQHMLASFPSALDSAARYERVHFRNQEGRTIMRAKGLVKDIQQALTNLTGLTVNSTTEMTRADMEACRQYAVTPEPMEEELEEEAATEEEVRAGQQSLRPLDFTIPSETGGAEEGTGNQILRTNFVPPPIDPTDLYLFGRRRRQAPEEATPTATTRTRCSVIENESDQFIYITELWIALYYLELDLKQKRNCLQA